MPATEFPTSTAVIESAVSETMKRMNATALALSSRRSEVNRRIRCLQQVMRGLRDLTARSQFSGHNAPSNISRLQSRNNGASTLAVPLHRNSRPILSRLARACRIALMESSTASLEEIRSRIVRRGSFSFVDSGMADTAIVLTLNAMQAAGDIRCVETEAQCLWQRITIAEESITVTNH